MSSNEVSIRAEEVEQDHKSIQVSEFLSEWSRCLTGKYQTDHLYRFGRFDDCGKQWQDLKTSMRAKFTRDEARSRELIQGTYHYKRTHVSPTAGVIWEIKEKPGW